MSKAVFGEHEARRARKPHWCDWCGVTIAPGETYLHWRGITDVGVGTYRNHPECQAAADRDIQEKRLLHDEWPFPPEHAGHQRGHTYVSYIELWGHDIKVARVFSCDCGDSFALIPEADNGWSLQHGDNPEHRSDVFTVPDLAFAENWLNSVHQRSAA